MLTCRLTANGDHCNSHEARRSNSRTGATRSLWCWNVKFLLKSASTFTERRRTEQLNVWVSVGLIFFLGSFWADQLITSCNHTGETSVPDAATILLAIVWMTSQIPETGLGAARFSCTSRHNCHYVWWPILSSFIVLNFTKNKASQYSHIYIICIAQVSIIQIWQFRYT